ncbi:MAG: hypothetical protein ACFFCS_07295 [Candidatus Hodarchaeota archaeon]
MAKKTTNKKSSSSKSSTTKSKSSTAKKTSTKKDSSIPPKEEGDSLKETPEEELAEEQDLDEEITNDDEDDDEGDSNEDLITDEMALDLGVKFWQKNDHFRSLLDPDIIKKLDLTQYDLAKLLNEFFGEMFKQEFIDFRVSGIAVHSAAKIHRWKIVEVLKQQEKEEEERRKEMLRRQIPSSISQPFRGDRRIATQDDFMGAMRKAIIEVMRKREKQRKRHDKARDSTATDLKKIRVRKKLPEGIRKAILGKERIEDTFDRWYDLIWDKAKQAPDGLVSFFNDLMPGIEKKDKYGYRFDLARLFLSLMFLRNRNKVDLEQYEELSDIYVSTTQKK